MDDNRVEHVSRDEFFDDCWDWEPGEHVSIIAPTNSGKTYLANQLLERTATKDMPAIILVMKPKDDTVKEYVKKNDLRIVRTWPPPISVMKPGKQKGYVVWPVHSYDPHVDDANHYKIFRRAILDNYKRGNRIIFADEVYSLDDELGLDRELVTVWTKGRSMGTSMWAATQKPTHVPTWMYDQAEHLFLAYDPDERNQKRFGEIGGMDPKMIREQVQNLKFREWLYIRRSDKSMCIVEAE